MPEVACNDVPRSFRFARHGETGDSQLAKAQGFA
jgi:hypothetical protein